MNWWRLAAAAALGLLVVAPLAVPLFALIRRPVALAVLADSLPLLRNTLFLIGGTLAVALPAGVGAAVLLYRTDLPFRHALRLVFLLLLLVPLPVLTSAWQGALGAGGWLSLDFWRDAPGRPWAAGLPPAVWIHAVAAVPWVVLIVGQGLRTVPGEVEEDALLAAGTWRVVWRVTLPRCRAAVAAAALWVGLQTAAEITVTDHMQVRTFAEEVYYQFWMGGDDVLARAAAVAVPPAAALTVLLLWAIPRLDRALPPPHSLLVSPPILSLGRSRWPWLAVVLCGLALLLGVPLGTLVWRAGLSGYPETWSGARVAEYLGIAYQAHAGTVATSLLSALATGALAAGAAVVLCWLALGSGWFRWAVFGLAALLWALPGPVLGIGLKETILALVDAAPGGPLAAILYEGPSPAPVLWAHLLRYLPCAVAVLWPVVRLVPTELCDRAALDGLRPRQELRHLIWPVAGRAAGWAAVVIAALSLGEVAAVAMNVETPGWRTFAHDLWREMHTGVQNYVAALCLLLLGVVAGTAALLAGAVAAARLLRVRRGNTEAP